jgi:hypothetical protein
MFDYVIEVPAIEKQSIERQCNIFYGITHSDNIYTKWNILNPDVFLPYIVEKVAFLDPNMLVVRNCDELFELKVPAISFTSPTPGMNNPYVRRDASNGSILPHGTVIQDRTLSAGFSTFFPMSSLVLLCPRRKMWDTFCEILNSTDIYGYDKCKSPPSDQILPEIVRNVKAVFRHIHPAYNWLVGHNELRDPSIDVKIYNYHNVIPWAGQRINQPDFITRLHAERLFDPWLEKLHEFGTDIFLTGPQTELIAAQVSKHN